MTLSNLQIILFPSLLNVTVAQQFTRFRLT